MKTQQLKKAVCAFILNLDGKVLTVSRKDDPNNIGLPGGKVDKTDLSEQQALEREVLEETGFTVKVSISLYTAIEGAYSVTTYLAVIDKTKEYVQPDPKETGIVQMSDISSLLTSSFAEYNKELLKTLNLI